MRSAAGELWDSSVSDHRARQSERISRAVLEIVTTHGISALTMTAIAEVAGISRQTLYRYFPDVESALAQAVRPSPETEAEFERRLATAALPTKRLEVFMGLVLEAAEAGHPSPEQFDASLPPEARAELRVHTDQFERLLVGILVDGVADGSFDRDLDPEVDGRILHHVMQLVYSMADGSDRGRLMAERLTVLLKKLVLSSP